MHRIRCNNNNSFIFIIYTKVSSADDQGIWWSTERNNGSQQEKQSHTELSNTSSAEGLDHTYNRLSSHCRLKWPKSDFFAQM